LLQYGFCDEKDLAMIMETVHSKIECLQILERNAKLEKINLL